MIIAIVTFNLPEPKSLAEASATFRATSPKYRGVPGLLRKHYWTSQDGRRVGGMYLWETQADADRLYTDEWRDFVRSKYGVPPVVEFLNSPVTVDNLSGEVLAAA